MQALIPGYGYVNLTGTRQALFGAYVNDTVTAVSQTIVYAPTSDIADGNWTDPDGGTVLYTRLNEEIPDERNGSYIQSGVNPSSDTCKIGFPAIVDPGIHTLHKVHYRIYGNADIEVSLVDADTNVIKTWTHTAGTVNEYTTFEQTLSEAEAGDITSYAGFELWFTAG